MKKSIAIAVIGFIGVLMACGSAYAWLGRMSGMGDPFGLVEDESDFLIHPALIANGDGTHYYGDYRFTWDDVSGWNHIRTVPGAALPMNASGQQFSNDAMVGVARPLGIGRLGVFFQYDGARASYNGREIETPFKYTDTFDLKSDFDQFALKVLYGLPVCNYKLGFEAEVAYRTEDNQDDMLSNFGGGHFFSYHNIYFGREFEDSNLLPYMLPFDSRFWETNLKTSFEGNIGGAKISATAHGGLLFSGESGLHLNSTAIPTTVPPGDLISETTVFNGDTHGYQAGGDLFVRAPLCPNLWLPLVVRVNYMEKDMNGAGKDVSTYNSVPALIPSPVTFQDDESDLRIQAGGGLDRDLGGGSRLAGGIYYNYIETTVNYNYAFYYPPPVYYADYVPFPASQEHQILLRLVGEKQVSPAATLRAGLNGFYGWVHEDFDHIEGNAGASPFYYSRIPLDGTHWGIAAFAGGTVKCRCFTVEPFVGIGYQKFDASGGVPSVLYEPTRSALYMDLAKATTFVTTGFSIKY